MHHRARVLALYMVLMGSLPAEALECNSVSALFQVLDPRSVRWAYVVADHYCQSMRLPKAMSVTELEGTPRWLVPELRQRICPQSHLDQATEPGRLGWQHLVRDQSWEYDLCERHLGMWDALKQKLPCLGQIDHSVQVGESAAWQAKARAL